MPKKASTVDQGFINYGASLLTPAHPFDPALNIGQVDDDTVYIARPGIDFLRPWIAIRNGAAFQWPLGIEGFSLVTTPSLGIHRFIGDNAVEIDVIHTGEEHITMDGSFPGDSGPLLVQALRDVVRKKVGDEGKILYVPEIMTHAQRVQVVSSSFTRQTDGRGSDMQYSIEFVLMGEVTAKPKTSVAVSVSQTTATAKGKGANFIKVDGTHNTLRKIANWKLGDSNRWRQLYDRTESWFNDHGVPISKAPDFRLPLGTTVYL